MKEIRRFILLAVLAILAVAPGNQNRATAASPPIGINVGQIHDWGPDFAFADAIKQSRYWVDAATGNNYNIGDANGWPTMDARCGVWYGNEFAAITLDPMNGTYALSFNGQAASISATSGTISNQVYNSGTNTTTATLTMTNGYLELTFTGTKRTAASATNTGITNVKLMRPSTEQGTTPYATTVTFQPAYETMLANFSTIRFMDWAGTNGSTKVNWSDRNKPAYYQQNEVSWEYCVQLCNETGKDMWVNIPALASDDYITKLAQLIKYGSDGNLPYTSTQASPVYPPLNPGLHCYVEYSNEVWNYGFAAYSQVTNAGNNEIFTYPVSVNGLGQSIVNGPVSSVGGFSNGVTQNGYPGQFPNGTTSTNPNYFRDVVFNNGSTNTSVMTTQTPASTSGDNGGGDELGMKFKTTQAGTITAVRYYKVAGETGTHVGNLWTAGGNSGAQVETLFSGGNASATQSVSFPVTGSYTIKFLGSTIPGGPNPTIQPTIDGTNVGSPITLSCGFSQYTSASFTINSTGSHTIGLSNTSASGSAYIDLVTVQGAGSVTVANNSFESPIFDPNGWQGPTSWTTTGSTPIWADPAGTQFVKKLGSATYTNETASGWQQATLSPAVSIAANTTYIVSTNSNSTYGLTNTLQIGPLTWDGNMGMGYYRKWVERAVQMSNDFRAVWGDSAMPGTSANPTIRPVLESTQGWVDNFTAGQIAFLQDYFNNPLALAATPDGSITTARAPTYYFYGGGGAAYYGPNSGIDINTIWTSGDMNATTFGTDQQPVINYALPSLGRRIAYEGGPSLDGCGCPDDAVKQQAWGDARMTTTEVNNQIAYNQTGGDLLMYFDTAQPNYQWAFVTDIFNLNTPKMNGITQIKASTQSPGTYGSGISGGATIPASTTVPSTLAPNLSNMSAGVYHTDYAGYVVSSSSAGAYNIALSAGSSGSTNSADVYFDGVLVGTITIPNTGSNTTYANTSTVTTASVPAGSHGVMVKVHAGSFGLNNLQFSGGTATVPPAPTGLAAGATYQQVNLTWTGSTGATSYNIYRGTAAGGENGTAVATGVLGTTYSNTGLTNGTTYYFKVAAVNSAGTSGMSNEASATPVDNTGHFVQTSTAPTIDGTVDSVWSNAPQNTISHLFNGPIPTGQTFSAKWQGLWDNTNLYILVQVTNNEPLVSNSASPWLSDDVELYIDSTDARPGTYQATDFQYELGYGLATAQETKHSPSSLTGVVYSYKAVAGGWVAEASIPWSTLGATPSANKLIGADVDVADGFNTGNTKLFWWDTDNTDWSTPSSFGTGLLQGSGGGAPAAPTGLTATAGNTQVSLSWTASSGATSYNVLRSTVSGSGYASVATGIASTSYTNTGLTNGTTYYFVVTATNATGTSGNSNQASATPIAGGAPTPIIQLPLNEGSGTTTTNTGSAGGSLTLTATTPAWSANVPANVGGAHSVDFGTTVGNFAVESGAPISSLGGLSKFTITGWVNCKNSTTGMGGNRIATWINNGANGVDLVYLTDGSLQLGINQWPDTSPAHSSAGKITTDAAASAGNWRFFAVTYDSTLGSNNVTWYFGTNSAAATADVSNTYAQGAVGATIGNLALGNFNSATRNSTTWDRMFRGVIDDVKVYGAVLTSAQIATVQGTTSIPAAPTGLTATSGNTQVALSWTASTGATSYNALRSTVSGSGYASVATGIATTSYTNTGLNNGTTYYFVVTATNASGTSGNSAQASATPQPAIPAAPTGLTATPGNAQVALSWMASTGATSYNALRSTVSGSGYASVATGIATTSYTNTGLTNGTTYYFVVTATNVSGTSGNSAQAGATPSAGATLPIQINAAGPLVSPFIADIDFSGGLTATNWTGAIDTSAVPSPAPQAVYQSERYGAMTYTIPGLTPGTTYTVRLHMCENFFTASAQRTFNVAINGTTVLTNFDIFATTGAIHKATVQQFNVAANASGQEVIAFTNVVNNALVNGIEIQSASSLPTPVILLGLNEGTGTSTANTGSAGGSLTLTATTPAWSANVPANVGGAHSVDFGTTVGNFAVESGAPIAALGGLAKFTITGWVNCKNSTTGLGGNRIATWINNGGNGVDLVYLSDGSLQLGVNNWPDTSPAHSSAAKITTDAAASAANWRFFAVTYDSTLGTNNVTWYFGTNTVAPTADVTNTYAQGAVGATIGNLALGNFNSATRNSTTWDRMFRGVIDDVHVYGAVLTPSQIASVW